MLLTQSITAPLSSSFTTNFMPHTESAKETPNKWHQTIFLPLITHHQTSLTLHRKRVVEPCPPKTQTRFRPFLCEMCNRQFVVYSEYKRHLHSHTKSRSYMCTHCGRTYCQKNTLIVHLYQYHNASPNAEEVTPRGHQTQRWVCCVIGKVWAFGIIELFHTSPNTHPNKAHGSLSILDRVGKKQCFTGQKSISSCQKIIFLVYHVIHFYFSNSTPAYISLMCNYFYVQCSIWFNSLVRSIWPQFYIPQIHAGGVRHVAASGLRVRSFWCVTVLCAAPRGTTCRHPLQSSLPALQRWVPLPSYFFPRIYSSLHSGSIYLHSDPCSQLGAPQKGMTQITSWFMTQNGTMKDR